MSENTERLDAITARDEAVGPLLEVPHLSEGYMALLDRRALLDLARKQAAALEAALALIDRAESHGNLYVYVDDIRTALEASL